jgi:hypothetical protein
MTGNSSGKSLLFSGVVLLVLASYFALVTSIDEGPRCLLGCVASLLRYYNEVYTACAICTAVGAVCVGYYLFNLGKVSKSSGKLPLKNDSPTALV